VKSPKEGPAAPPPLPLKSRADNSHQAFKGESPVNESSSLYRRHRFPGEIINYCVWLYYRFSLSYRDIEEMMAQRGVRVTYESIRQWCLKFGQAIADELRRCRPRPGEKWHLDEVYLKIDRPTTCGGPSISRGSCSTSSRRVGATSRRR